MKYITLPVHLIQFWYVEGLFFFFRSWKHLMLYLEEDLAVNLMMRLLFVPLFHDSTFVGRMLSFIFRLSRIFMGLFAFAMGSVITVAMALYWFAIPFLAPLDKPYLISQILLFAGTGLFLLHISTHPHKKVRQVKEEDDLWLCSKIEKNSISFKKLLGNLRVQDLLANLEIELDHIPSWEIKDMEKVSKRAFELAKLTRSYYIEPNHFFVAALEQLPDIDKFLLKFELTTQDFENALMYQENKIDTWRVVYIWDEDFIVHHLKGINRGWLGVPTPALDKVGEDITKKASEEYKADFIRNNGVMQELVNVLSQQSGNHVVLVGPAGSGKSALVYNLAKQIVKGDAPASLATKRIVLLDLGKLLFGVKTQGDLAQRVKDIFDEVSFAQNIIIVVEEIHELGMGEADNQFNLYSLMQPYLESDAFQFIGTTEPQNYSRTVEKNSTFARLFRKIEMLPATPQETLMILQSRAINTEKRYKIKITWLALKAAVELSRKLVHDKVLPDSAISLFKEAQTMVAKNGWLTKDLIKQVISSRVKIPLADIGTADKDKLLNLETEIHLRMIDQERAVKAVSDALRRSATGLKDEKRPIGSFLFVGPTGVGKTELAKTLAQVYFKTSGVFIRFDMSEYQNPDSVNKLIGATGEAGILTEEIRNRPYSLLLLDEFEKADPRLLTLFLQVLEDGRLTDGAGRLIDFANTIIIATSNAGSLTIAKDIQAGKDFEEIDKKVHDELLEVFRPELVNRFDDIIIFKPLSEQDLEKIVTLKLTLLQKQLKDNGYLVEFDYGLVAECAKRGFDPVLGARPLRRLIQDTLESELSKMILEGKLVKGQTFKAGVDLLE